MPKLRRPPSSSPHRRRLHGRRHRMRRRRAPDSARTSPPLGLAGARTLPFPCSAAPDVRLGGLAPWRIRRLQAFVEEHLSQSIHIVDLSGAVGLSVPHFSRAFALSFGEPPHLYVIQRRLDRARHLMLTSDMALSELAVACGFNDQAHFCRLFRQHTGRTPAAWRREWRDAIRANGSSSPLPRIAAAVADQGVESRRSAAA
jgi:AraC-like DNA-binding protein